MAWSVKQHKLDLNVALEINNFSINSSKMIYMPIITLDNYKTDNSRKDTYYTNQFFMQLNNFELYFLRKI